MCIATQEKIHPSVCKARYLQLGQPQTLKNREIRLKMTEFFKMQYEFI